MHEWIKKFDSYRIHEWITKFDSYRIHEWIMTPDSNVKAECTIYSVKMR